MLPTSPRPLSGDNFKPRNVQNSPEMCFGPKIPKYGNSVPETPQKLNILNIFMFNRSDSLIRFQRALGHYLEIILSQEMSKTVQKCVLGTKSPNMVIRPKTRQKLKILNFFIFTRSDSLIHFQRALNHYLEIILSREMSKTVQKCVLGPKSPNMVIRPQPPKILKYFENF